MSKEVDSKAGLRYIVALTITNVIQTLVCRMSKIKILIASVTIILVQILRFLCNEIVSLVIQRVSVETHSIAKINFVSRLS